MLYFKITYKNYFYTGIPPPKKIIYIFAQVAHINAPSLK